MVTKYSDELFIFPHNLIFAKDSELILDGMVLRIQKLFPENKPQTGSYLLSGPHSIVNTNGRNSK